VQHHCDATVGTEMKTQLTYFIKFIKYTTSSTGTVQTSTKAHLTSATTPPQPFYGPFSGITRVSGASRELLGFMVQGEINRGRHTDHPTGRHSIQTNQCPPYHPPPFFMGRMPYLPPNQQCQSTEGN